MSVAVAGGVGTIAVVGEVDSLTSVELRDCLVGTLDDGARSLVVDCSRVTFIDSSGLSVLIDAHQHARVQLGSLIVRNPSPMVRRLLDMTGLTRELEVDDSAGTAS
jgi:anti-sigma B factor antagonist